MSRGSFVWTAALVLGLAACADLKPLREGTCGNGVVEGSEDCDTVSVVDQADTACAQPGEEHECRQIWDDGGDVPIVCPDGWGQAADGTCGRASKTYFQRATLNNGFDLMAIGDADGDQIPDLIGQTRSNSVEAWIGDGTGDFANQSVLSVSAFEGTTPALGYLDDGGGRDDTTSGSSPSPDKPGGDALIDAVVPQALGLLVMRSQAGKGLEPVIFPTFTVDFDVPGRRDSARALITAVNMVPIVSHGVALFESSVGDIALSALEGEELDEAERPIETDRRLTDLVGSPVHVDLDTGPAPGAEPPEPVTGREELLFGFAGDPAVHVIRFLPELDAAGPFGYKFVPEALPALVLPEPLRLARPDQRTGDIDLDDFAGLREQQGIRTGHLDGDSNLDVIARAASPSGEIFVVLFRGNGDGTFQPGVVDARFNGLHEGNPGCGGLVRSEPASRWPLAVGDLTGDGFAEVVGHFGAYYYDASLDTFCMLTPDLVQWLEATIADFNRDGLPDVAASPTLSRAVDFRINAGFGLFNRFQIPTEDFPTLLRVGDFDGDRIADLAMVEVHLAAGDVTRELTVLFGDPSGPPGSRTVMGPLGEVSGFEVASSPFDFLGFDAVSDVMIQQGIDQGAQMSILTGSGQRRMISPLALLGQGGPADARVPMAVQIGRFRSEDGSVDGKPDLFSLAIVRNPDPGDPAIEGWIVPGASDGSTTNGLKVAEPYRVAVGDLAAITALCAQYATGDLGAPASGGDPGLDEIVVVDTTCLGPEADVVPKLQVFRTELDLGRVTLFNNTIQLDADLRQPRTPRLADLDFDGDKDIVVVFGGNATGAGRALVTFTNDGVLAAATQFTAQRVSLDDLISSPLDVAVLNADDDPALEIAVLFEDEVQVEGEMRTTAAVVLFDQVAGAYVSFGIVATDAAARRLIAADVDRDGIDDIITSGFFQTTVHLGVRAFNATGLTEPGGQR